MKPSEYLGIKERYWQIAIDLACSCAHWEAENYEYKKSKDKAGNETSAIGDVLEDYRRQLNERG